MTDLHNRFEALATEATARTELQNPRLVARRSRSLSAWVKAIVAAVVAAATFSGGAMVLNTGDSTEVRTIERPVPSTEGPVPAEEDAEPADPAPSDPTPPTDPAPVVDPPTPDPGGPVEGSRPGDGEAGTSAVHSRYGEMGPTVPVPPNDRTLGTGTAGSGCRPRTTEVLPDGVWMVVVVTFGPDELEVDLVCYTTVESSQSGELFEDFIIENDSSVLRTVPLAADARFYLQTSPPVRSVTEETAIRFFGDPGSASRFAEESGDASPLGWLLVEDGQVVELYSPPLGSA